MGLRLDDLGTERLTWRDLLVVVQHRPQDSALARALDGDEAVWSLTDHLLAITIDVLNIANWQRENAGKGKGQSPTRKPKRMPRPGVQDDTQKIGAEPIPIKDFDAWWDNVAVTDQEGGVTGG